MGPWEGGAQSPKSGPSIEGSKRALRRGVWAFVLPLVLLLLPFIVLFGLLLTRLLLARGFLAIVTRAGRGSFSGHVALVRYVALARYLARRISAPDLRSTAVSKPCYTCRLDW